MAKADKDLATEVAGSETPTADVVGADCRERAEVSPLGHKSPTPGVLPQTQCGRCQTLEAPSLDANFGEGAFFVLLPKDSGFGGCRSTVWGLFAQRQIAPPAYRVSRPPSFATTPLIPLTELS